MSKPHVEVLIHEEAGRLVKIKEVVAALKWFRGDVTYTMATHPEYRKGALEMLDIIIAEVYRWSKKP